MRRRAGSGRPRPCPRAGALAALEAAARAGRPVMDASIECALARATTGEWTAALRGVWGEYRAPSGVTGQAGAGLATAGGWDTLRARVAALLRRPKLLVGKPGLDGHSNDVVPASDHAELLRLGVVRVFTPSAYKLTAIVGALVGALVGLCLPGLPGAPPAR